MVMGLLGCLSCPFAVSAATGPVYLKCSVTSKEGRITHQDLTLDEDAGTAGIVVQETGASDQRRPATFSTDHVSFAVPFGAAGEIRYDIDRVSLAFSRTGAIGTTQFIDRGWCALARTPKRAF
ncbi:MAG: hypothetical protein ACTHM0_13455 [Sphingomonas sp.]